MDWCLLYLGAGVMSLLLSFMLGYLVWKVSCIISDEDKDPGWILIDAWLAASILAGWAIASMRLGF